ncbi:MAG: hypothetical protein LAO77_19170, partial [Acidobacteriia bacterium]|nr:hypothetical protein [Terriglobia bacterium]
MSPRPYATGRRRASADATKRRVLAAGRDLLVAHGGKGLTVYAVAARAGVARILRAADEHRLDAVRHIVRRLTEQHGRPSPATADDVALVLFSLTSFES